MLLTLLCVAYIIDARIFFNPKVDPVRGKDVHPSETRRRKDYRNGRHGTAAFNKCTGHNSLHVYSLLVLNSFF